MDNEEEKRQNIRVTLIHSSSYTSILHRALAYVHHDRDLLLAALLDYCGFLRETPRFFSIVPPMQASRKELERFHSPDYLDLLEYPHHHEPSSILLEPYGLVDDCPLPKGKSECNLLWSYIRHVAGASLQAAKLLASNQADVVIHWGGGRHHAHKNRAGGFCFVNDVVLAIQSLHRHTKNHRVLYFDIDIHHADGVQTAFYDTNKVMNVSMHRHTPGFFPAHSGSMDEKGLFGTDGVGHTLNIPMPQGCTDLDFIDMFQYTLSELLKTYNPDTVVLCVGADGLYGDPLVGPMDSWHLTPEGIAECVRITAQACSDANQTKLLLLGAGGYHPARAARTFLLCTAAACEGARPGMLWNELPKDMPRHDYFPRYGPDFSLVGECPSMKEKGSEYSKGGDYGNVLKESKKAVDLALLYIQSQKNRERMDFDFGVDPLWTTLVHQRLKGKSVSVVTGQGRGRRRKCTNQCA